jgi:hypothetical protein
VDHRRYLKPAKAAEKIGVTVATMANWRWKEVGPPFYRVGGLILYEDREIDAWISAGRQSTGDANQCEPRSALVTSSERAARAAPSPAV